jgi:hypothetical protein
MSLAYLTLELIKRLLRSDHVGAPNRLRDEVRGILEAGAAPWLPDEFQSGGEALASVDSVVTAAERESLRKACIAVFNDWGQRSVAKEAVTGVLGAISIAPILHRNGDQQWATLCSGLWDAVENQQVFTSPVGSYGYSNGTIANGFAWIIGNEATATMEARLAQLVITPSQQRSKHWPELGLHYLYALCSRDLPSKVPQKMLSKAFEPWIASLSDTLPQQQLGDGQVAAIQRFHSPDGRRLHHLLYRSWIQSVPKLSANGIAADSLNWLADRADKFCRVSSAEGAFCSANAMLNAMLRQLPRDRIQLVLQAQAERFDDHRITDHDETMTSEAYQVTKRVYLDHAEGMSEELVALDNRAEQAARRAPAKSDSSFMVATISAA